MKKFYLLLLAVVACIATAFADENAWTFTLKVKGADRVTAFYAGYYSSESRTDVPLVDGDNEITVPYDNYFYVVPNNAGDLVTYKDCDGTKVTESWTGDYYYFYVSSWGKPFSPYTLTVISEEEYRDKSLTVTMDDCSKVTLIRQDGTEIEPTTNEYTFRFNSDDEKRVTIKPRSYSGFVYAVTADGVSVPKSTDRFYVDLVKTADDEPVYTRNINVTADAPEGVTFHTSIELEGDDAIISYIKVGNTEIEDLADALTNGFDAPAAAIVIIGFNTTDYKIDQFTVNGEDRNAGSAFSIDHIGCDQKIFIKGHVYATYSVRFNITCPEGIKASLGSTTIAFVEGVNDIEFKEGNNYVTFSEVPGYKFDSFTDANDYDYLTDNNYSYYHKAYIYAESGEEYTIVASKIRRDNVFALYVDDMNAVTLYSKYVKFPSYEFIGEYDLTSGYHLVNFRPEDGKLKGNFYGYYDGLFVYHNDESFDTEGYKMFENLPVEHNDVVKIFFENDPANHTVTFEDPTNALSGYEVKKDLVATVDPSAPVKATGFTRFTIAPVTRADKDLTVKIGDTDVEPVDGVYTFETTGDTTVSVLSTSGIENVISGANTSADVYNLQGIRVAVDASADDVKALPAGIYIVNGTKVLVK